MVRCACRVQGGNSLESRLVPISYLSDRPRKPGPDIFRPVLDGPIDALRSGLHGMVSIRDIAFIRISFVHSPELVIPSFVEPFSRTTRGIDILQRVVVDVAVAIQGLRITRRRHGRIRRDKPANRRVIRPGGVPVEAGGLVLGLAGELAVGVQSRWPASAVLAVRPVAPAVQRRRS